MSEQCFLCALLIGNESIVDAGKQLLLARKGGRERSLLMQALLFGLHDPKLGPSLRALLYYLIGFFAAANRLGPARSPQPS